MNSDLKNQKPFRPGIDDYDRYDPHLSEEENLLAGLWVRPNPELEVFDIRCYAMTFDGYGYAGRFLEEKDTHEVFKVADRIREQYHKTARLEGSFTELRLALFAEQRIIRNQEQSVRWDDPSIVDMEKYILELNSAICDAWEREVEKVSN